MPVDGYVWWAQIYITEVLTKLDLAIPSRQLSRSLCILCEKGGIIVKGLYYSSSVHDCWFCADGDMGEEQAPCLHQGVCEISAWA